MSEWHDWDGAEYELGIALGLFDPEKHPFATKAKHVFWTNNPVGNALHSCLESLVEAGILEGKKDGGDAYMKFRWNQDFVGTWEGAES